MNQISDRFQRWTPAACGGLTQNMEWQRTVSIASRQSVKTTSLHKTLQPANKFTGRVARAATKLVQWQCASMIYHVQRRGVALYERGQDVQRSFGLAGNMNGKSAVVVSAMEQRFVQRQKKRAQMFPSKGPELYFYSKRVRRRMNPM